MEIKDMTMEQIEARLAEIKTEIDGEGADIEALSAEVDSLEERQSAIRAEAAEKRSLLDKVANMNVTPIDTVEERENKMENIEYRNTPEYIEKFAEWFKDQDNAEKRAALLTENVDGQIAVPDLVYDEIKTAWDEDEILRDIPRLSVKGNLKVNFEISASDAVKHTEGSGAVDEQTMTEGIITMVPAYFKKWKSFSDEVMSMRGEAFLRYIYRELAHHIMKAISDDLIDQIAQLGTTATDTAPAAAKITGAPSIGLVAQAMGNLSDEANRPVVVMNKLTWSAFKAAQYAGQFNVDPFEGLEVRFTNKLKAYSAASTSDVYMIVGDFRQGALINMPNGDDIEYTFDNISRKKEDLIEVLGKLYAAVAPVASGAFVNVAKA